MKKTSKSMVIVNLTYISDSGILLLNFIGHTEKGSNWRQRRGHKLTVHGGGVFFAVHQRGGSRHSPRKWPRWAHIFLGPTRTRHNTTPEALLQCRLQPLSFWVRSVSMLKKTQCIRVSLFIHKKIEMLRRRSGGKRFSFFLLWISLGRRKECGGGTSSFLVWH